MITLDPIPNNLPKNDAAVSGFLDHAVGGKLSDKSRCALSDCYVLLCYIQEHSQSARLAEGGEAVYRCAINQRTIDGLAVKVRELLAQDIEVEYGI